MWINGNFFNCETDLRIGNRRKFVSEVVHLRSSNFEIKVRSSIFVLKNLKM